MLQASRRFRGVVDDSPEKQNASTSARHRTRNLLTGSLQLFIALILLHQWKLFTHDDDAFRTCHHLPPKPLLHTVPQSLAHIMDLALRKSALNTDGAACQTPVGNVAAIQYSCFFCWHGLVQMSRGI